MVKKKYNSPEYEVEIFTIESVFTASSGLADGDNQPNWSSGEGDDTQEESNVY